jgi:hypothetical protein
LDDARNILAAIQHWVHARCSTVFSVFQTFESALGLPHTDAARAGCN